MEQLVLFFEPLVEEITSFFLGIGLALTFVKQKEKDNPWVLNIWSYRIYLIAFFLVILAVCKGVNK